MATNIDNIKIQARDISAKCIHNLLVKTLSSVLPAKSTETLIATESVETAEDTQKKALIDHIRHTAPTTATRIALSLHDTDHTLYLALSIVPRTYTYGEIYLPNDEYLKDIAVYRQAIRKLAQAYWAQYVADNPQIYDDLCAFDSGTDFSSLHEEGDTLYFNSQCEHRMGVFHYWDNTNENK